MNIYAIDIGPGYNDYHIYRNNNLTPRRIFIFNDGDNDLSFRIVKL